MSEALLTNMFSTYKPVIPTSALRTPCLPGCPSVVGWEYDPGEPTTRDYPGQPPAVFPVEGCSEYHLERIMDETDHEPEVWRLVSQWELLEQAALRLAIMSRRYLQYGDRFPRISYDMD